MKTNDLKCTDLRIGNWVKVNDPIFGVNTYKVAAIRDNGIITLNDNMSCLVDNIEPIELTEKLLYKIGFCFGGASEYGKYYGKTNGNDTLWCKIYESGDMSLTCNNNANLIQLHKAKYLHELQNAYYCLTEQELKVKL